VPTKSEQTPRIELHMATNHLGHFLLTNLLLPKITATPGARIVSVSSLASKYTARENSIDYETILGKKPGSYVDANAYAYSKLANLLFTEELGRRLKAAGADTLAIACHPGYSRTSLQDNFGTAMWVVERVMRPFMSQDAKAGCLPLVMAATDLSPAIQSGAFYGPTGTFELGGPPGLSKYLPPQARDPVQAEKLWKISEELTGISSVI
jgi:NAD(P)-dependent dehydrogenase (short-subunit alcohol dehydrogenase family)